MEKQISRFLGKIAIHTCYHRVRCLSILSQGIYSGSPSAAVGWLQPPWPLLDPFLPPPVAGAALLA